MPFLVALLKKLALSFVFEFAWEQLMKWLAEQVHASDNKIDDEIVQWISGKKAEVETSIRQAVK